MINETLSFFVAAGILLIMLAAVAAWVHTIKVAGQQTSNVECKHRLDKLHPRLHSGSDIHAFRVVLDPRPSVQGDNDAACHTMFVVKGVSDAEVFTEMLTTMLASREPGQQVYLIAMNALSVVTKISGSSSELTMVNLTPTLTLPTLPGQQPVSGTASICRMVQDPRQLQHVLVWVYVA